MLKHAWATLIVLSIASCVTPVRAECEDALIKDTMAVSYRNDIRTALLDTITQENYSTFQANGQMGILVPEFVFDGKFQEFAENRQTFSRQYGYSFADLSAQSYVATRLSANGRLAYAECLKGARPGIKAYVTGLSEDAVSITIKFASFPNLDKAYNVVITPSTSMSRPITISKAIPGGGSTEILIPRDPNKTMIIIVTSETDVKDGEIATSDKVEVPKDVNPVGDPPLLQIMSANYGDEGGSGHCVDNSDSTNIAKLCNEQHQCLLAANPSLCSDGRDSAINTTKNLHVAVRCGMQSRNLSAQDGHSIDLQCPPLKASVK